MRRIIQSTLLLVAILFTSSAFATKINESLKLETKPLHGDSLKVKADFTLFSFILIEPAKKDSTAVRKEPAIIRIEKK